MIKATLLGTGGATPYKTRTTPMLAIEVNENLLMIDCGSGATIRLAEAGISANSVDCLLFTHFHADHCVDFPVLVFTSYLAGRVQPLRIIGPSGTKDFVNTMLYDLFPYIPDVIFAVTKNKFELCIEELEPGQIVELKNSIVKLGEAKHGVDALCFRVETTKEALTISGDTAFSQAVIDLASDSQVLIHECPFPVSMGSIPTHTTPEEVGVVASKANISSLVLTHLFEAVVGNETAIKEAIERNYAGPIHFGEDLMTICIDGDKVEIAARDTS